MEIYYFVERNCCGEFFITEVKDNKKTLLKMCNGEETVAEVFGKLAKQICTPTTCDYYFKERQRKSTIRIEST